MKNLRKVDSHKIVRLDPIEKNGWNIQASTFDGTYILTVIESKETGQVIIRHFDDEFVASHFVVFLCEQDASQEQDI